MARRRRRNVWDEDPKRRALHDWIASAWGPARRLTKTHLALVGQLTERLFLLANVWARSQGSFYCFDAREGTLKRFNVPPLAPLLTKHFYGGQTLRYDRETGAFFHSVYALQESDPGFTLLRDYEKGHSFRSFSTTSQVSSLFVGTEHVFLLDAVGGTITRVAKSGLLALADSPGPGGRVVLDLASQSAAPRELAVTVIPLEKRLAGEHGLFTGFSNERLIFGRAGEFLYRFPAYPQVHALNLRSTRLEGFWFPSFAGADLAGLADWADNEPERFEKYLALLSLYEADESNNDREPLLFTTRGLLLSNGEYRPFDLEAITEDKAAATGDLVDFRFRKLMSTDRREVDRGIIASIDAPRAFTSEAEIRFIGHKIGSGRLETANWDKLAGRRIDRNFLEDLAKVVKRSDDRIAVARRWLARNPARQFVALSLLTGRVDEAGAASDNPGKKPALAPRRRSRGSEPIPAGPSEIPVRAIRVLAESRLRSVRVLAAVDEDDRSQEQRSDLADSEALLEAVAAAAISWTTEAGYEIIRWLDAQNLPFLQKKIATLIGDTGAHPVRDLLERYLAHEDPDVVSDTLLALWYYPGGDLGAAISACLRSAEDTLPRRAAYALGIRGVGSALIPLLYSDIISAAEDRADRDFRMVTDESEAADRLLRRIFRFRGDEPPFADSLRPDEIAELTGFAPFFLINLLSRSFQKDKALADPGPSSRRTESIEVTLGFLHRLMGPWGGREAVDIESLQRIACRSPETLGIVERILRFFLASDLPSDAKYLLALHLAFAPDLVGPERRGRSHRHILILLEAIFDRMSRETDFRRTFAAFALVELGFGKEPENQALEFYRKDEWSDWPRLLRLGEWALRRLPRPGRAVVYEKLLLATKERFTVSQYAKKLAEADPRRAAEIYEAGAFSLSRLHEAFFYGRAGDRRGYEYVLANFTRFGDIEGIKYLGDHGGAEAIPALEKARDELSAPEEEVARAIRKIRRRLKAGGVKTAAGHEAPRGRVQ
jgi:hypothetical protein